MQVAADNPIEDFPGLREQAAQLAAANYSRNRICKILQVRAAVVVQFFEDEGFVDLVQRYREEDQRVVEVDQSILSTEQQNVAARMLVIGATHQEVANRLNVSERSVDAWVNRLQGRAEGRRLLDPQDLLPPEKTPDVLKFGLALKRERMLYLQERFERLKAAVRHRQEAYKRLAEKARDEAVAQVVATGEGDASITDPLEWYEEYPGIMQGFIVKEAAYGAKKIMYRYKLDAALMAEFRALEKHAAQEMGEWTEKQEIVGDRDKPIIVQVIKGVSVSDLIGPDPMRGLPPGG